MGARASKEKRLRARGNKSGTPTKAREGNGNAPQRGLWPSQARAAEHEDVFVATPQVQALPWPAVPPTPCLSRLPRETSVSPLVHLLAPLTPQQPRQLRSGTPTGRKPLRPLSIDEMQDAVADLDRFRRDAADGTQASAGGNLAHDIGVHIAALDVEAFNALDTRVTHPHDLPEYALGRAANRFRDVLPNPSSRVRLAVQRGDQSSEYINACWVRGFKANRAREYIAAQGPLPTTVATFNRMVWEKDVKIIVMLTKLEERGRTKCERYWPERVGDSQKYGGIRVTLKTEEQHQEYAARCCPFPFVAVAARLLQLLQFCRHARVLVGARSVGRCRRCRPTSSTSSLVSSIGCIPRKRKSINSDAVDVGALFAGMC